MERRPEPMAGWAAMDTEAPPRAPHQAARILGPLHAVELAEAAVLADVTVALCLLGWLLPIGAILIAFGVVPMATIAARHRVRAVIAAGVAASVASLLVAGTGVAFNTAACAAIGAVTGFAIRRGWGRGRTVLAATTMLGVPGAAAAIGALAMLSGLRRLALVQVTHTWRGISGIFDRAGASGALGRLLEQLGFRDTSRWGDDAVAWMVHTWPVMITAVLVGGVACATWLAHGLALPTLKRLEAAVPPPPMPPAAEDAGIPAPVPVQLERAGFRYPGAHSDALSDVSVSIGAGELVAIVGPNGSGKSTLGRILAGAPTTSGLVVREGPAGLGRHRGTALMFQRPETQVLGVTAADDVLWGLPRGEHPDVSALLARVGLGEFGARETATLSGGELQRLALAAALARSPRLLVADEATAMVDPEGRAGLVDLLRSVADDGTAVAFITHRADETVRADRVITVESGRISTRPASTPAAAPRVTTAPLGPPLIRLSAVGHVYARRGPWAHRALQDVELVLAEGEGVLVVGRNGSGKSTLAWILAGLLVPSEGEAKLRGRPVDLCLGEVALAFQHPRLQLLRDRVGADVRAASGADTAAADHALTLVGLDPGQFRGRHVDHLSGGEQRRVALAGLLAARPRLLVLDEPFAGLDSAGVSELTVLLARLRSETGLTLVVVSHDTETLGPVVEREVRVEDGRIVADTRLAESPALPPAASPSPSLSRSPSPSPSRSPSPSLSRSPSPSLSRSSSPALPSLPARPAAPLLGPRASAPAVPTRRRPPSQDFTLLRPVPGNSVIHRLWAGTKLLALVAIAVALSVQPSWPAIAVIAPLVAAGVLVARIPRGAVPRLPRWFWIGMGISVVVTASAGGAPNLHLGGVAVGFGALADWARVTCLALVVLTAAALVSWTTPVAAIAPALSVLGAPLRWIGLPIDEWAIAVGLSFRCLPLLIEEVRTLAAVRRLRDAHRADRRRRHWRHRLTEPQEFLTAAITVALRRGDEFAAAMEARGGLGAFSADRSRPTIPDGVAFALVAGVIVVALAVL